MKKLFAMVLLLGSSWAALPATPVDSAADTDYAVFQFALDPVLPPGFMTMKPSGQIVYMNYRDLRIIESGWKFYTAHPTDPRRWDVAAQLIQTSPSYIVDFKPEYDENPIAANLTTDPAGLTEWNKKKEVLRAALSAAKDLTDAQKEAAVPWLLLHDIDLLEQGRNRAGAADLRVRVEAFAKQFPKNMHAEQVQFRFAAALEHVDHAAGIAYYRHMLDSPMPYVRFKGAEGLTADDPASARAVLTKLAAGDDEFVKGVAAGQLKLLVQPFVLKFTALDGRAVDVAKLRGKVVLVDYWATWCGPCTAELPNIKKVYAGWHDKGFEVIGITLENAGLSEQDTPSQTAAKLDKARNALIGYVRKRDIPWPQYFDGKYYKTDVFTRYGLTSIPAMFLLDKQGQVVSTSARGEKLESEVKRLLGG